MTELKVKTPMKTILSSLAMLLGIALMAQTAPSFPDSNAVWSNLERSFSGGGPILTASDWIQTTFEMGSTDTLINGVSYSKISQADTNYVGAVRSAEQKVWFVPHEEAVEHLLYDFGAQIGDSINDIIYYSDLSAVYDDEEYFFRNFVVQNVDSIELGDGTLRRRLSLLPFGSNEEYIWVEGIGNMASLFWSTETNVSNYQVTLGRFCSDGVVAYQADHLGTQFYLDGEGCQADLTTDLESRALFDFQLSPNPTSGRISITVSSAARAVDDLEFTITDIKGRKVREARLADRSSSPILMDISEQPQGLYIITLHDNVSTSSHLFMKE